MALHLIAAWALLALAVWVVGLALFADRPRKGRQRCPKCRYDLTGIAAPTTCPECGRVSKHTRALRKPRRRWGLALLALLPLLGAHLMRHLPALQKGEWWAATPTTVLILLPGAAEQWDASFSYERDYFNSPMTPWNPPVKAAPYFGMTEEVISRRMERAAGWQIDLLCWVCNLYRTEADQRDGTKPAVLRAHRPSQAPITDSDLNEIVMQIVLPHLIDNTAPTVFNPIEPTPELARMGPRYLVDQPLDLQEEIAATLAAVESAYRRRTQDAVSEEVKVAERSYRFAAIVIPKPLGDLVGLLEAYGIMRFMVDSEFEQVFDARSIAPHAAWAGIIDESNPCLLLAIDSERARSTHATLVDRFDQLADFIVQVRAGDRGSRFTAHDPANSNEIWLLPVPDANTASWGDRWKERCRQQHAGADPQRALAHELAYTAWLLLKETVPAEQDGTWSTKALPELGLLGVFAKPGNAERILEAYERFCRAGPLHLDSDPKATEPRGSSQSPSTTN